MEELKLGIITCLHGNLKAAKALAKFYSKSDVDAIIFNGDTNKDGDENSIYMVLKHFKKIKKPTYITPGSHETYSGYKNSFKKIKNNYIKDCTLSKNRKIKLKGYHLVFLPGSDVKVYDAGFQLIGSKSHWLKRLKRLTKKYGNPYEGIIDFFHIDEIKKYVTDPNKTVLICHVPPRFFKKNSIDVAKFGRPKRSFNLKTKDVAKKLRIRIKSTKIDKDSIFIIKKARKLIKKGYPIEVVTKNVGNIYLKRIIKKLKIKKFICGHIHEAGQKANDLKGNLIKQNIWSKELFHNAAPSKDGYSGIFTICGDKAKYKNIKVRI